MSWRLDVPLRDPDEALGADALIDLPSALEDPDDRRVCRELLFGAFMRGLPTVGALVAELEQADESARRRLLDEARVAAGLESATTIDDRERFERVQREAWLRSSRRDAEGKTIVGCAAEGCSALPMGATGMPEPVSDRRWWCDAHRHLAGPDDHLPPDDVVAIGPNFEVIPAPSALAAMAAKDEQRRQEEEQRRQERAAEAEAIRKARERFEREHADDPYYNPLAGSGWAGIT
jgi:hypothetical protein